MIAAESNKKLSPPTTARVEFVCERPGDAVNVFVHGYSAGATAAQRRLLHEYVRRGSASGRSYLLSWRAGDLRKPLATPVWTRMLRLLRGGVMSPAGFLAEAATWGLAHAGHYKLVERDARRLGGQLDTLLAQVPELAEGRPLNLVAHSIGAVVVAEALLSRRLDALQVHHCVLLGAAGSHEPQIWLDLVDSLQGKLFHCYSQDDLALLIRPGLRPALGRRALGLQHERICDRPFRGIGHRGYWPALARVLPVELQDSV